MNRNKVHLTSSAASVGFNRAEKSLNVTPSSYFAVTGTSVIIIRWQKVTPRGAHYEFHKLWGRPVGIILNNRYERGFYIAKT